ncbi:MAG: glycosyl hydrolase family 28 protein, partial [Treponemataceae bacterium]
MKKTFYGTDFDMDEILPPVFSPRVYNLTEMGGRGDSQTDETEIIRNAIETCSREGGGTVLLPEGLWLTGPIHLKSGVNLRLEKNATLKFSSVFSDYLPVVFTRWEGTECYNYSPLIYADGCENIGVSGEGTLLGNGEAWWHWKKLQQEAANRLVDAEALGIPVEKRIFGRVEDALRPQFIQPINCRNVLIEGITIKDGPMWTIHPVYCENVIVRNVSVISSGPNTDGLNPDSCKNVLVEKCSFETGDD